MGEGIEWRRMIEAAGILRPKGQYPSPWLTGTCGGIAFIGGIFWILFGAARERWLWAIVIVLGAAELVVAVRRYRSKRDQAGA
jgi:hypothetical protein